jgi:hypothetical protein
MSDVRFTASTPMHGCTGTAQRTAGAPAARSSSPHTFLTKTGHARFLPPDYNTLAGAQHADRQ